MLYCNIEEFRAGKGVKILKEVSALGFSSRSLKASETDSDRSSSVSVGNPIIKA